MNATIDVLKRWRALDRDLGSYEGMHLPSFARRWKVSQRTIRRDLGAFAALGHAVVHERDEDNRTVWRYDFGVEMLFTSNISPRVRKAVMALRQRAP